MDRAGYTVCPMPAALAPLPALSTEVCSDAACTHASSPREMCTCTACEDGAGHGIAYAVDQLIGATTFTARADVARGFTRAMLAAVAADDEAF